MAVLCAHTHHLLPLPFVASIQSVQHHVVSAVFSFDGEKKTKMGRAGKDLAGYFPSDLSGCCQRMHMRMFANTLAQI